MSRLDSAIRRLQAQRSCIDRAAELVGPVPGVVFELGLGNGRTFDHLQERLPGREIFVFERAIAAHPDCIPDDDHLFLGDLSATLPAVAQRFAGGVALVHSDIGTGDQSYNAEIASFLSRSLGPVLAAGAVIVSDQPIEMPDCEPLLLPDGIAENRYFMIRRMAAAT